MPYKNYSIKNPVMNNIITICTNLSQVAVKIGSNKDLKSVKSDFKCQVNRLLDHILSINNVPLPTKSFNHKCIDSVYSPVERAIKSLDNKDVKLPTVILDLVMEKMSPFDIYFLNEFDHNNRDIINDFVKRYCPNYNIDYSKLNRLMSEIADVDAIRDAHKIDVIVKSILYYLNYIDDKCNVDDKYEVILIDCKQHQAYYEEIKDMISRGASISEIEHSMNMHLLDISIL